MAREKAFPREPQKRILYLGNKLSKHGYTPTNIETLGPQLAEFYDVITASDKLNKVLRLAEMTSVILRYRSTASLILIDTYSTQAFQFAKLAARLAVQFRIPYVAILHGGDLPKMLKTASDSDFAFFRKAAKLVTPSQYLYQLFQQFQFKHLEYIPNNIELDNYPFKLRTNPSPRLLWVRSFHKIYNPNMAIQVLRQLLKDHPDARLCMVGPDKDGSMERSKKLAATFGISDKVEFTGRLEKSQWLALSSEFDIFINTTNVDNTPVSVMEAMALGLPVISTNAGGIPYLVQDGKNGLLVPMGNAEAMSSAINLLLSQPGKAAQMANDARHFVEQLSWQQIQQQWLDLVEELAK